MIMPGFDIRVDVRARGPIFNGLYRRVLREYQDRIDYAVANEAENYVRQRLSYSIKNRTGYYESRIGVERAPGGGYEVTDHGVIYGAWLNGSGSRNYPVTRFRGYHAFDRARTRIRRAAPGIARRILPWYVRRL